MALEELLFESVNGRTDNQTDDRQKVITYYISVSNLGINYELQEADMNSKASYHCAVMLI